MKLLLALDAPTWREAGEAREGQARRSRIAAALRDIATQIEQGRQEGGVERPALTAKFRIETDAATQPDAA